MSVNKDIYFWVTVIDGVRCSQARFKFRADAQDYIDLQSKQAIISVVKGVDNSDEFKGGS